MSLSLNLNSIHSSPVFQPWDPALPWPIFSWTRVLILNPSHMTMALFCYIPSTESIQTLLCLRILPWLPLKNMGISLEICISYPYSGCNFASRVGSSPTLQTRAVKQSLPNYHALLWSCCLNSLYVVHMICPPGIWRAIASSFPLRLGNRISLSCTVTVMLISLFPHSTIRKSVNTVAKLVTSGCLDSTSDSKLYQFRYHYNHHFLHLKIDICNYSI